MEFASQGIRMNKDKPELTWERIYKQIDKKRFELTQRTRLGRLLKSSKPERAKKGVKNEGNT